MEGSSLQKGPFNTHLRINPTGIKRSIYYEYHSPSLRIPRPSSLRICISLPAFLPYPPLCLLDQKKNHMHCPASTTYASFSCKHAESLMTRAHAMLMILPPTSSHHLIPAPNDLSDRHHKTKKGLCICLPTSRPVQTQLLKRRRKNIMLAPFPSRPHDQRWLAPIPKPPSSLPTNQRKPITLISRVQTLRIHTFNLPSTPSTPSNSTPSHQHRRAGFRQNKRSFWAIPTASRLFTESRMSVRKRASARLQITALLGSPAL